MRRLIAIFAVLAGFLVLSTGIAAAGSPHFVDDQTKATINGNTLTVDGKLAGLGDEAQVHIVVTADASCINRGGHNPSADNKDSFSAADDFPVQNGKADFSLTLTATFDPGCSPPMSVKFTSVVVTDTTNGISLTLL